MRVADGNSVLLEFQHDNYPISIKNIFIYHIETLADRKAFESIDKTMTMPELVEKVGLPIQANYKASIGGLYFPVSDGTLCYIQYFDDASIVEKTIVSGFQEKGVLIYED